MPRRRRRWTLFLQLIPVIVVAIAGIYGAAQLKVVREFLAGASGEPANIQIDPTVTFGPLARPWKNLAQGGEMSDWRLAPIHTKVAALKPQYIRLDHIYSFYDIYQERDGQVTYNFSKLDPLIDDIVKTGAKPYIALSYLPAQLADDGQITGKPKDWNRWRDLVRATIQHYSGEKGISDIYYEVWNEPDLFGGWKTYGDKNYLTLYTYAAQGQAQVRNAKPYKFGGPGITALYENWFVRLVEHAQNNNLRLDFFSWHRYNLDIEQFRQDYAEITQWRARYPGMSNLELHVTETGHDSRNHPGYDTSFGAAHTAAMAVEAVGVVDRVFIFEVEDGKDPKGAERWGRWGLLTHRDFGANIKPRYLALRLLDRIQGEQIQLLGKGTWVKGVATNNNGVIETILVNYDRYGSHVENVPITYKNVPAGSYTMEIIDTGGQTRRQNVTAETTDSPLANLATQLVMSANSVVLVRLVPDAGTPALPTGGQATTDETANGDEIRPTAETPPTSTPTTTPSPEIQNPFLRGR